MSYRKRKAAAADDFFISPEILASLKLDEEPIDYMDALGVPPAPARDWAKILRELIDYCDRGILPEWMESRPEPEINIDWIMNLKLEDFEPIAFDWTLFECLKL